MKLTKKQFSKIEHLMPVARKPATISNYQFLCALPYIIENGCKWRVMPKEYGNRHSVYMKFSRWSKNGTIQKIFGENRREPWDYERELYKRRKEVERYF